MEVEQDTPGRELRAPVAVRTIDLDRPAELELGRPGDPYRSALLVARWGGRPIASATVLLGNGPSVPSTTLRALFADARHPVAVPAPSGRPPSLSVVVTTCARPGPVIEAVESILACDPGPLEVIVVENRPAASRVAAALEEHFEEDPRVRCLAESRVGLSSARNAGLDAVRGEVVAFTDDDVVVDRGWIGWIGQAFASVPDAVCVTGLILPLDLDGPDQVRVEEFAGFGKGFERQVHRLDRPTSPLFPYAAGEFGSGACTALRTDFGRLIGGFDPALGAGTIARGGEDLDLYVRVLLAGRALVYEPAAIIWHRHPSGRAELRSELFGYGVSLTAMLTKHMINGHARRILRRVPEGARFLGDPASRKNRRKGPSYPRGYDWVERTGMVAGPFAYLVSRRREARTDATAQQFSPTWVTELDLARPAGELRVPKRSGEEDFARARVLVRRGVDPISFINVGVVAGVVTAASLEAELRQLAEPACKAGGSDSGTPPDEAPPMGVVLCTRDRPRSLRVAIQSILAASNAQTEIIIVDSAPLTDATAVSIAELGDPRVRRIVEPIPGLARARNRGLAEIDRELVAFTDDDVIVDPGWLAALARGFERSPDVACVTGLVPAGELATPAQAFFDAKVKWSSALDPRLFDLGEHRGDGRLFPFTAGDMGAGANFAVRLSAVSEIGTFDEALGVGTPARGGEDLDLFARTVLAGWTIAFEPAAIVWHFHRREESALRKQMYGYGSGLTAYAFKHVVTGRVPRHLLREARSYRGPSRRPRRVQSGRVDAPGLRGLRRTELRGMLAGPGLYLAGRIAGIGQRDPGRSNRTRGTRAH